MKRIVLLLAFLLSFMLIVYAKSGHETSSAATAAVSQEEISAKLTELEARAAALQAELAIANRAVQQREQRR